MSQGGEKSTLLISCACKQINGSVEVSNSDLPLPVVVCHCDSCRHQTGLLATSSADIPSASKLDIDGDSLACYRSSADFARYFCSNCGTKLYMEAKAFGTAVSTGVVHESEKYTKLSSHIFVDDTKDGGLATWLPQVPCWSGLPDHSKRVDPTSLNGANRVNTTSSSAGEVKAHCLCQGVCFKINRPTPASKDLTGPFSNFFVPYVPYITVPLHTLQLPAEENENNVKWWLRSQGTKYLAGCCMCNSCRANAGFEIQMWTFVPKVNTLFEDGSEIDFAASGNEGGFSTLKEYKSSEGVQRHFCSRCGATVFFRNDERPKLLDVSVGLLEAEEGARAESWLDWWYERVSFEETTPHKDLLGMLKDGLKAWGDAKKEAD